MFFTPGWAAILTAAGTLGGVAITQFANSALSWRTTRKERNKRITEVVADLIATGNGWVYAVSTQEQDLFHAIETGTENEGMMEMLKARRAEVYAAQLAYGRAQAAARLTCPDKVHKAAEAYSEALIEFEEVTRAKGSRLLDTRSIGALETTTPEAVTHRLLDLVKVTRKATGQSGV